MINKSKFTLIDKNNAQYYREFSNISESIVSFIIEKLISYTFTELDRKDLDCKLPDHCFEFLQGFVNNCVKAEFIAHDRDDLDDHRLGVEFIPRKSMQNKDNSNLHSTNSFEENLRNYALTDKIKLHKQSTNRMNNTDTLNSDESGFILNNNVNRPPFHVIENSLFYDNLFIGTNEWGVIPEPGRIKIDRAASSTLKVMKSAHTFTSNSTNDDNTTKPEQMGHHNENKFQALANETTKTKSPGRQRRLDGLILQPRKKALPPVTFPCYDVPKEKLPKFDEDPEIERIRKDKEVEVKRMEEEKIIKNKSEKEIQEKVVEIVKKQKEYERKNVTKDANGEIILIKPVLHEALKQEFISAQSAFKDIKEIINPIKLFEPVVKPERSNAVRESLISERKASPKKHLHQSMLHVIPNKKADPPAQQVTNESSTVVNKYERAPITPAGSSFDMINLEVGVSLYEDLKYKTGGKDFYKKFQKYSMENYNKHFKETASHYNSAKENTNNGDYDYEAYGQIDTIKLETYRKSLKESNNNQTGSITFKNKNGSLRSLMDGLDLISEIDETMTNVDPKRMKNENLFKAKNKRGDKDSTLEELDAINKFNHTIVQNTQWGNNTVSRLRENLTGKSPHKPQIREIERELGKGIVKTKMPRSRVFAKVISQHNMMAATMTSFNSTVRNRKQAQTQGNTFKKEDTASTREGDKFNKTSDIVKK